MECADKSAQKGKAPFEDVRGLVFPDNKVSNFTVSSKVLKPTEQYQTANK